MLREKRTEPRYGVELRATVRNGTGSARKVRLCSLSTRGCRFESPGKRMGIDAFLTIRLGEMGFLDARVKWREGDLHGVRFEQALHPAVLDHIREWLALATKPAETTE